MRNGGATIMSGQGSAYFANKLDQYHAKLQAAQQQATVAQEQAQAATAKVKAASDGAALVAKLGADAEQLIALYEQAQ
jgi:4-diphosphocytidyl-2C-methyl-D-erythritol kinase